MQLSLSLSLSLPTPYIYKACRTCLVIRAPSGDPECEVTSDTGVHDEIYYKSSRARSSINRCMRGSSGRETGGKVEEGRRNRGERRGKREEGREKSEERRGKSEERRVKREKARGVQREGLKEGFGGRVWRRGLEGGFGGGFAWF